MCVEDLDYMHARYYSPGIGRFLSLDPVGGNPRAPQGWNRFAYVLNNPLRFTDPYGLQRARFDDEITVCVDAESGDPCSVAALVEGRDLLKSLGQLGALDREFSIGLPGTSVRDFALAAGPGTCQDFTCQVLAGIGQAGPGIEALEIGLVEFTAGLGLGVAGRGFTLLGSRSINILTRGLGHTVSRHTVAGSLTSGKSVFFAGENLVTLAKQAGRVSPIRQPNQNFAFVVDAGRAIGIDRRTGAATRLYTVITDHGKNVVTMFPGIPGG